MSEDERRLYVASLAAGPGSITRLAVELDISRPYAHKLAQGLERRGLGSFGSRKKYARDFSACSPEILLELLRTKRERSQRTHSEFVAALPDLLSMHMRSSKRNDGVRLLEGTWDNIKRLRKEMLEEAGASGLSFFGSSFDWSRYIDRIEPTHKRRWIAERVRKGIRSRALVFEASPRNHAEQLREVRILRNVLPAPIAMQLYGKKAVVWLMNDSLILQITDADIVRVLRNLFDACWLRSAPFRPRGA